MKEQESLDGHAVKSPCMKVQSRRRKLHVAPGHVTSFTLVTCSNRVSTTCGHCMGQACHRLVNLPAMLCLTTSVPATSHGGAGFPEVLNPHPKLGLSRRDVQCAA